MQNGEGGTLYERGTRNAECGSVKPLPRAEPQRPVCSRALADRTQREVMARQRRNGKRIRDAFFALFAP